MGNNKSYPSHFPYPASIYRPSSLTLDDKDAGPSYAIKTHKGNKRRKLLQLKQTVLQLQDAHLFDRIPDEILMHMLSFLFDSNDIALLPSPVAAMLVCSRWHRIVAELEQSTSTECWKTKRDEIVFRRRPDYVKKKIYTTPKLSRYEGEWVREFGKHGRGKIRYPDGDIYEGDWWKDSRHGHGAYIWATGHTYIGEWYDGHRHGFGTYTSPCGNHYTGQWKNNLRHGKGVWIDARGMKYEGEYVNGKAEGFGLMTSPWGSVYRGQWHDGHGEGWGIYCYSNGEKYEGQWTKGKRDGWGIYRFKSGDQYSGGWKDGVQHGRGTFYFASGETFEGEWTDGAPSNESGLLTLSGPTPTKTTCLWSEIPNHLPKARNVCQMKPLVLPGPIPPTQRIFSLCHTPRVSLATNDALVSNAGETQPIPSTNNNGYLFLPHSLLWH